MIRRPPKQRPMTNLLLKAIKSCGRTPYQLAKEAGVKADLIYRFVKGKNSLRLASADRLVNALHLKVTARRKAPHKIRG